MDMQGFSNAIVKNLLDTVTVPFQDWFNTHPFVYWFVAHPVWLLISLVAIVFLLSGLIGAIGQLTQKIWIALLQAPIQVSLWIWRTSFGLVKSAFVKGKPALTEQQSRQERLQEVLNRLESIRQEQDELLQEVKALMIPGNSGK